MNHKVCQYQGLTFDDVLLEPRYSEVVPADVRRLHAISPSESA